MMSATVFAGLDNEPTQISQQVVVLSQDEIDAILGRNELYVYFGPEVCSAIRDLPCIHRHMMTDNLPCQYLTALCNQITQGKTTASFDLVDAALYEAAEYLASNQIGMTQENAAQLFRNLEEYYEKLETGMVDLVVGSTDNNVDTSMVRSNCPCTTFPTLTVCNLTASYLEVECDATINGDLTVGGNEIIKGDLTVNTNEFVDGNLTVSGNELVIGDLTVTGTLHATISPIFPGFIEVVGAPQQGCIIFVDDAMVEKARICTSTIPGDNGLFVSVDGGATQNLRVNNEGGTVLAAPTSGATLSVTGNAGVSAIVATGNGTVAAPALTLIGNPASTPTDSFLTIDATGVVREGMISTFSFIMNGCQAGPITIGTSDATALTLATDGCTPRVTIDPDGAVSILMPAAGEALTVDGNVVLPAANGAETQGILKLGDTGVYEFGTRNLFAGSGAVNSSVTGADNISIGTTANSALTTQNNTIAIGNAAQATATDSITIGNGANTSAARTIVLGSTDSAGAGAAPTASALNAIAIGNASGANAGASATGVSSISIGGSDGTFTGAAATGDRSIAVGVDATSSSAVSIALGSASGTVGGNAPVANNSNAIAIGSANGANAGAAATGISAVAIGGAGPVFSGAQALGDRSVAIGLDAVSSSSLSITLGSASGTAGGSGPIANNTNAIAIGSANGANAGAVASGIAAIAVGSADTALFAGAQATGDRSIALGINATASNAATIAIGGASGLAGGTAPVASNIGSVAIGSGFLSRAGAMATGISSVAIGGADGTSAVLSFTSGAVASGDRTVAIGVNATASAANSIAIGSAGTAGSVGATASAANAIAIGGAAGAGAGASATGIASVAIGNASSASGARSVAIGVSASTAQDDAILLGDATRTTVKVGIGIAAPIAKLDIVGVNNTPVIRFDQVTTSTVNSPIWLNPSTSAVAGTPIHYNASNQLFGFTSSERYKTNIRPITTESEIIYQLNPVLYDPKEGFGVGHDIPGFIAEEVNLIAPNLVIFNCDHQPENVAYNSFHALAIKELQGHQQLLESQNVIIAAQGSVIDSLLVTIGQLQATMSQLEASV